MNQKDYSLGEADQLEYAYRLPVYSTMELYIETLTGTCFELRVSPYETVISVKAKIQRLEGIPIAQQYLIWQNNELEDEYCLHDYNITDGCTLKLVLAMRGGPINTRRVAMEEPSLREMADYMESNREELFDKLTPPPSGGNSNKQVTLLVYRDGDQLNFFRVVDRGDGTLTPFTESLSGSACNLRDDDDEYDEEYLTSGTAAGRTSRSPGKQNLSVAQMVENNITAIKMKKLRAQMVNNTAAAATTSKSNTNIGVVGSKQPTKPKATKPPTSARLRDSKLRRELMEKLNLRDDDDDTAPQSRSDENPTRAVQRPMGDIIPKLGDEKKYDAAIKPKEVEHVVNSASTRDGSKWKAIDSHSPSSSIDSIVAPKKITKAEMLRARFKRLKNVRENIDDDDKVENTAAQPNTATTKSEIEEKTDVVGSSSQTPPETESKQELGVKSHPGKKQETTKKNEEENSSDQASSSGRFSPRTRRLLNALEHNTNPRRTLPNRTILPKPTANDMMQGLTFNRHDLYLKSYGLIRSPEEETPKDEEVPAPPVPPEHHQEVIDPRDPAAPVEPATSPKVLETPHGVKYSALGGGSRAPYYWGRYLKSPPVWNGTRPEVSSPNAEESWHVTATAHQKHVSPRVPSGTLKPINDASSAGRKSFAAGRKSVLTSAANQQQNLDESVVKSRSDEKVYHHHAARGSPKLSMNPSAPSLPKHIYPHPPSSSVAPQSWHHQKQFSRCSSLTNSTQYPSSNKDSSSSHHLNRRPSESQLSEEDSFYLRSRQSRQTPIKSSHRLPQTMESPHVESMTKQEAREVVDFINKAVDASILRNLVRSPNKDMVGNQRGASGHGSNRYPVPPYHRNPESGRALLRSGVSRHAVKQSSPVPNAAATRTLPVLPPVKSKKKRCFLCGKRTGLATSYMCRCGNNFCAAHRYAETHDCSFDYKAAGRKLLEEANPLVSAPKLPKI